MIADHDGHLIALGQCDSVDRDTSCHYHGGSSDIWLVKMDAEGNILWQKCYGGSDEDDAYQIFQTRDSGFLFIGKSYSDDGDVAVNPQGAWMVKVDSNGNIEWQQGLKYGLPHHLMQLNNGKFLLACSTINTSVDFPIHYGGQFTYDAWIWLLTEAGDKDTGFIFGGSIDDVIYEVLELPNGDWELFGYSSSTDHDLTGIPAYGNRDGWILRTDSNGVIKWQKRYGDGSPNIIVGSLALENHGFLAAGNTYGSSKVWVLKLDTAGNKIVDYAYGGSGDQVMRDRLRIHSLTDNIFVIGALTSGGGGDVGVNYGLDDFWCLTVDSTGQLVSSMASGGTSYDRSYTSGLNNQATGLLGGSTSSNDFDVTDYHGAGDGWFIKLSNFTLTGEVKDQSKLITVFPNPLHEQFTLAATDANILKNASLEIHDVNGAVLLTKKIHGNAEQLSVKGLKAGTYLFVLRDKQQQQIATGKLIIQ